MLLLWWVTSISEVVVVDFKKCLTAIVVKSLRIYCWFQRMSNNLQSYYVTMSCRVDMWQCHKTFQYGIGFITASKNPVSWASFTLSVWFLSYSSVEISINFSGFSLTFRRTFSNFLWYFSFRFSKKVISGSQNCGHLFSLIAIIKLRRSRLKHSLRWSSIQNSKPVVSMLCSSIVFK